MTVDELRPIEGEFQPQESGSATYEEARARQIASALNIKIYGIPISKGANLDGFTPIVYCGFQIEGYEHKDCSSRIWHIPTSNILATSVVVGFACEGENVHYFVVPKDTSPIEEEYVSLSLGSLVRNTMMDQQAKGGHRSSVFAARVGKVLEERDEVSASGFVVDLQRQSERRAPIIGGPLSAHYTTWVWTKEVHNSRYDPMKDGDPSIGVEFVEYI